MDRFATIAENKKIQKNDFIWCCGYIMKRIFHAMFCVMPKFFTLVGIIHVVEYASNEKFIILNQKT